jgi:hypothetical protein
MRPVADTPLVTHTETRRFLVSIAAYYKRSSISVMQDTHHHGPTDGVRLLLLGATGAVGQQVLRQALADARVVTVLAPTRRSLPG